MPVATLLRGQSESNRGLYGEPSLEELLSDPIVQSLMKRDGVKASDIANLMQSQWHERADRQAERARP